MLLYTVLSVQVTPKTLADVKGGTLISYEGKVQVSRYKLAWACLDYVFMLRQVI